MKKPTLDYLAAKTAQRITQVIGTDVKRQNKVAPKDVEILATKALGVLQAQGVYAMALFLLSRSGSESKATKMSVEERVACEIMAQLWPLRKPIEALEREASNSGAGGNGEIAYDRINEEKKHLLQEFADLTKDLDTLLLVRDLYEQTLVYARYGAKATKASEGTGSDGDRRASP
ncbi:MAG: hypothetical protein D6759_05755 [Chloroflexi bacterium]|nr:MAG: hypothetical protein D6759_05755 [Chloroflexota bacterium]